MSERRTARAGSTSTRRASSRHGRAILAGGLVLGVGAAITLANWNDSEFVNGTFAAGIFALEGSSTDGTTFSEHSSAGSAAVLDFQLAPDNLAPGDVVYAQTSTVADIGNLVELYIRRMLPFQLGGPALGTVN